MVDPKHRPDAEQVRRQFLKALGLGTAGVIAGCLGDDGGDGSDGSDGDDGGDGSDGSDGDDGDTLRIGAYGPLTGPTANIGEQKQTGWEIVTDLVNESGGVGGDQINLLLADSESEPGRGRSAVNRLVEDEDIDIIGGGYHSDVTLSVIEVADANDLPQIIDESVSGAINDKILEQDMQTVFKTAPPSQAYGVAWGDLIADFQEEGVGYFPFDEQRIALIAEDTSYGITTMEDTAETVQENGWEVISQDEVPLDETDFTSLLSRISANDPDVVWAVQTSSAGTGALAEQFSQFDFGEAHFMHNFGLTIGEALDRAGPAANGAFTLIHPDKVPDFVEELGWQEAWDSSTDLSMTGPAATSMTNIKVIAEIVESAGGAQALRDMSRSEFEQHVIEHEPIQGSVGIIDYQENHQAAWGSPDTIPSIGYQVVDGDLNFVWPFEIAATEIDESFY